MKLLLAASALVLMAAPAFAQISASSTLNNANTSSTQSQSSVAGSPIGNGASSTTSRNTANNRAASQSSAQNGIAAARTGSSNAAITINNGAPGDPSAGTAGDPTSTNNVNYSGGYTLRNVPEVIAPNVVGGNPCAVGISGGLAVSGFGITGGGTWADRQCERRQQAALLYNIGQHDAAVALMCQDDHVRDALIASGQRCPGMAPPAVAAAAPPAAQPWLPQVTMQPPPQPIAPVAAAAPPLPDWCSTVTGRAEQVKYQTECHFVIADETDRRRILKVKK